MTAINASSFGQAAGSSAPAGLRPDAAIAATFMQLLEDELRQLAPPPPQPPAPQPLPAPQACPWIAVPVALPSVREEKDPKKRPPGRGDRRSGRR